MQAGGSGRNVGFAIVSGILPFLLQLREEYQHLNATARNAAKWPHSRTRTSVLHQKLGRANILYAVGKSKLANIAPIACTLLGDQVRLKQSSLYREAEGNAWTETGSPRANG